jgi:AcrR family transcriptional regulator
VAPAPESIQPAITDPALGPVKRQVVSARLVREPALDLFARQGYHGTAVSEIAAALKIRTPSLYNHIESKQQLLADIIGETTRSVWAEYQTAVAGHDDLTDKLRAAAHVYALRHATHPREALIVNRDVSSLEEPLRGEAQELRRRHERAIRDLIASGCREGVFLVRDPLLASFGILELCVSIARWFRADGRLSAEDVAAQYAEFAVRIATG